MAGPPRSPASGSAPGPLPAARRYWESFPTTRGGRPTGSRRPWSRFGTLVVVVGAVELVLVAGVVTNWFGQGPNLGKGTSGAAPPPSGRNPNPFGERVDALEAVITYSGNATGYFPGVDQVEVCARCPLLPTVLWDRSPPQALVPIFFNVTNTGTSYHEITEFMLTTTQQNQSGVFELFNIYCCAANNYDEDAELVGFVPGQTIGLEAYILGTTIPSLGGAGYDLMLTMDSPG